MLQQTQVSRVILHYEKFLGRYPTLESVAAAPPRRIKEAWQGLGYYARARNLHRLAREVTRERDGMLPSDPVELRSLPGIGAYTAGAVASFAYERRAELVDTNVARVLRRVFAPDTDPRTTEGRRHIWALARATLPRGGSATWTHNQALMELGALICTARTMQCSICPVRTVCATGGQPVNPAVMPAEAGIQKAPMDSRLRGNDRGERRKQPSCPRKRASRRGATCGFPLPRE